jgi:hypothetical protein
MAQSCKQRNHGAAILVTGIVLASAKVLPESGRRPCKCGAVYRRTESHGSGASLAFSAYSLARRRDPVDHHPLAESESCCPVRFHVHSRDRRSGERGFG